MPHTLLYTLAVTLTIMALEIGLLIPYYQEELDNDYIYGVGYSYHSGNTITKGMIASVCLLFLYSIFILYVYKYRNNPKNYLWYISAGLFVNGFVILGFFQSALLINCTDGVPACLEIYTPLYVLSSLLVIFWWITELTIIGMGIYRCCRKKPQTISAQDAASVMV
jgi:hypothetical protein